MTPQQDISEARRFLTLLDATATTWTWQTFDDNNGRRNAIRKSKKHDPLARIRHGTLDHHAAALLDCNMQGAGIFVMVNAGDGQGREKENVTTVRAVFADLDGVPLKDALLAAGLMPHIVIESSPGRAQIFWRVDGLTQDQFTSVQRAIASKIGSDPSVVDPNRVMRVPGFLHQKGEPFLTRILHPQRGTAIPAAYTAERILGAFPSAAILGAGKQATAGPTHSTPLLQNFSTEAALEETIDDLRRALAFLPADDEGDAMDKGRSNKAWSDKAYQLKTLGERGRELFHEYSSRSAAYDAAACDDIFDRAEPTRTSWKSIFTEAQSLGWENPRKAKALTPQSNIGTSDGLATIAAAIEQLKTDPGALYEPHVLAALRPLHSSNPAAFARIRAQAKASRVIVMEEFDRLTEAAEDRINDVSKLFEADEPSAVSVDGTQLLADIVTSTSLHVIAEPATMDATALWIVHTWLIDEVTVTPIAHITAPEMRCGKTVLLTLMGRLSYRPLQASNVSAAALFRTIEQWHPTLLIDETDSFLRRNEEARGILNSGNTRANAFVLRCDGEANEARLFSTWGAKALCGIGKLPGTLADRCIPLRLRRKTNGERVANIRHTDATLWSRLRSRLARWALDNNQGVATSRPTPIEGLNDRANDSWEPLLAIADAIGGEWPQRARTAAIALHGIEGEAMSVRTELLSNIRDVFERRQTNRIFNANLLEALLADTELRWATWNHGKAMTPRQLASQLAEFGIRSHTVRIGADTKRGYELTDFVDAFARYLPGSALPSIGTSAQSSGDTDSSVPRMQASADTLNSAATLRTANGATGADVPDRSHLSREQPK